MPDISVKQRVYKVNVDIKQIETLNTILNTIDMEWAHEVAMAKMAAITQAKVFSKADFVSDFVIYHQ